MGKTKQKKKDFQKVKLKVGKQLKKADNVTTGSFQTRSIQVIQRLKSNDSQPSTKRNLNIKELLTQCQHYSISVRHDALTGMRELLTTYPDLVRSHLAVVLERAASMFSDKDAAVRQADIKLLKTILPRISERQISSFFPIISAHLCCSMSHIYDDIQADSLKILDLFLDNFPQLVIGSSNQLLPNFIEQISSSKTTGDKKRTLNVNPNRKTTSQKWRSTVLERLYRLLSAVMKYQFIGQTSAGQGSDDSENGTSTSGTFKWERDSDAGHLPIPQTFLSRLDSSGMLIRSNRISKKRSTEEGYALTGEGGMEKFVQVLVPLLLECWVEAEGSHHISSKKGHSNLISQESLGIRGSVLQVIQLLWQCVDKNNPSLMATLQKKYLADFRSQFMQHFPYAVHQPAERTDKVRKPKQPSEIQPSATGLNLALCDIMSHFMSRPASQSQDSTMSSWESNIFGYLGDVIQEAGLGLQDQHTLVVIIYRLLSRYQNQSCLDNLLQQMLNKYTNCHPLANQRKGLLNFFADIFMDHCYEDLIKSDMAITFLKTLPEVFFQSSSKHQMAEQVLMVMKKAVSQSNMATVAMEIIQHFVDQVLDQSSTVFDHLDSSTQKKFMELIYYVPPLQESSLSSIVRLFRSPQLPVDLCLYIIQILQHRYMKQNLTVKGSIHHISTLLSILISPDDDNEEVMNEKDTKTTLVHCHDNRQLHCHFDVEIWERALTLIKAVCSTFQQFENTRQVAEVLESFLLSYLCEKRKFSSQNLMAVVILANHMNSWKGPFGRKLTEPVCCYIWCLFNTLVANGAQISDFIQNLKAECADFVVSADSGVQCFLENMSRDCKSAGDEGDIQRVCEVASILLINKGVLTPIHQHIDSLNTIISSVQNKFPSVLNKQWWSDFLYLVSTVS
ncbi:testis-expressed protein 10-like [Mizuhopecten yessoensis]|uniref:Testis-expressed sequence 10 protein-like n=1 Tax=Mizuhopecten yessoensis TaxID=6573 RepID=A0A210PSA4_MIZYE|nr:testis-expressed protein 10-like [Mizuhopecten yessoensis]OWF39361.1 Testis-expressed sequence 10 protein-like [Mizuhopecten yessoensis]